MGTGTASASTTFGRIQDADQNRRSMESQAVDARTHQRERKRTSNLMQKCFSAGRESYAQDFTFSKTEAGKHSKLSPETDFERSSNRVEKPATAVGTVDCQIAIGRVVQQRQLLPRRGGIKGGLEQTEPLR